MILAKKIQIKLKDEDARELEMWSDLSRELYNTALEQRILAYKKGVSLSVYDQKKEVPKIRQELPEYKKVYSQCLRALFFRLDKAFKSFFRRCKQDEKKKGFPRFRGKYYFFTLMFPGMYVEKLTDRTFKLPGPQGIPRIIVKTKETIPDTSREVRIYKSNDKWFASFSVDVEEQEKSENKDVLAIDIGIKNIAAISSTTGKEEVISNRKPSMKELKRLDNLRSKRDKCKKGSKRWKYLTKRLRDEKEQWKNRSDDHLHKVSHKIMTQAEGIVVIGDIKPSEMVSGNKKLNRWIHNEGKMGRFIYFLTYKSKKFGKELVKMDEAYTSQDCSNCGFRQKMPLWKRVYTCPNCGLKLDRDLNSARNLLNKFVLGQSHDFVNHVPSLDGNLDVGFSAHV